MLANYQLGHSWAFNWDDTAYFNDFNSYDYVNDMLASSAIQRAVVLLMAKNQELAEKELRYAYKNMNERQKEACLYLAAQYNMPALGIKLANEIKDNERSVFTTILLILFRHGRLKADGKSAGGIGFGLNSLENQHSNRKLAAEQGQKA